MFIFSSGSLEPARRPADAKFITLSHGTVHYDLFVPGQLQGSSSLEGTLQKGNRLVVFVSGLLMPPELVAPEFLKNLRDAGRPVLVRFQ